MVRNAKLVNKNSGVYGHQRYAINIKVCLLNYRKIPKNITSKIY
jgi:hypothetical protein